jgi:hypothetical protein
MDKGTVLFNGVEVHVESFIMGMNTVIDTDLAEIGLGSHNKEVLSLLFQVQQYLNQLRKTRTRMMRDKKS